MQSTSKPTLVPLPFANSGAKNAIPTASQIGIIPGAASLTDGFPPLTRVGIGAGGIPPDGADMNGILNLLSQSVRWTNAGGGYVYDAVFSVAVGGYPKGSILLASTLESYWMSTVENNTTNPDTGGAGWVPVNGIGLAQITLSNINVTLTPAQYSKSVIGLIGTLTSNVQIFVPPALVKSYVFVDGTSGGSEFTISVVPIGFPGGVLLTRGVANHVSCVGGGIVRTTPAFATQTNVNAGVGSDTIVSPATMRFGFAMAINTNSAYLKLPNWLGGWIFQWVRVSVGDVAGIVPVTMPFPLTFPTRCFTAIPFISANATGGSNGVVATIDSTALNNCVVHVQEYNLVAQNCSANCFAIGN